jgi:hypothetical protein
MPASIRPASAELVRVAEVLQADAIGKFREGVIVALPSGYRVRGMPNFLNILKTLDTPEMYQFYRQGSRYVQGGMYASASYSRNLGSERDLGDFTATVDWILPKAALG